MPRQAQVPWYPSQLTSVANGHDDFRCERTRRKQYAPPRRGIKINFRELSLLGRVILHLEAIHEDVPFDHVGQVADIEASSVRDILGIIRVGVTIATQSLYVTCPEHSLITDI